MKNLQEALDSAIEGALDFPVLATRIIERKFRAHNIVLDQKQLKEIQSKLELPDVDGIAIDIDLHDDQLIGSRSSADETNEPKVQLDLNDADVEDFLSDVGKKMVQFFPEIVTDISQIVLAHLKSDAPSMLREHARQRRRFEAAVGRHWGKSLDLLESFIVIALEAGEDFNREFRPQAAEEQDHVFEVLTRLHARACQIASEILTLLRAGHADGAHARWRSLHEIAVVGFFIAEAGDDTAERFLLHDAVESFKAAKEYQDHCLALGYEPLTDDEVRRINSIYDKLVARYGVSFKGNYGWAAFATGKNDPTFKDIEQAIRFQHMRPFYRLASHNVHANPKGVFLKLGLFPGNEDLLIAGPSCAGLADPGHGTAISLMQITVALLTLKPNLDRLVICDILTRLVDEIGEALICTHQKLEGA